MYYASQKLIYPEPMHSFQRLWSTINQKLHWGSGWPLPPTQSPNTIPEWAQGLWDYVRTQRFLILLPWQRQDEVSPNVDTSFVPHPACSGFSILVALRARGTELCLLEYIV